MSMSMYIKIIAVYTVGLAILLSVGQCLGIFK